MHLALRRLIQALAEEEADRICARQKEEGPDAEEESSAGAFASSRHNQGANPSRDDR